MTKSPWYQKYFIDKNITVMGLGLLGRGIGDTLFLLEQGAHLTITDLKNQDQLAPAVNKFSNYTDINWVLGKHRKMDFKSRDMIVYAAGVPLGNEYLATAQKNNIPTVMSAAVLVDIIRKEEMDVTVIGVTGSKGKSTVTGMIESILKQSNKRYHVAGNVRGRANLPLLKKIKDGDIVLMELDSWQLQGFGSMHISPDIAVVTNFFPDHMNYYKGSMKKYFKDKANIFRYQKHPACFLSPQARRAVVEYGRSNDCERIRSVTSATLPQGSYQVLGEHNRQNLALAFKVGTYLDISEKIVVDGLELFTPVEGRMQYIGQYDGVHFYNDNNSTTPESTLATLKAISQHHGKKVVWWGGGADKQSDYSLLKDSNKYVSQSILFEGDGTDRMIKEAQIKNNIVVPSVKKAVSEIAGHVEKKDVVVFSPAASSFGMFVNEYDRNDRVVRAIKKFKRYNR